MGVRARIGRITLAGRQPQADGLRSVKGLPDIDGTVVYIACEGEHIGVIELRIRFVRPPPLTRSKRSRIRGVERTVLITGDAETPTQRIATPPVLTLFTAA